MPLAFLDTSGNRRLTLFTRILALTTQSVEDPREVYQSMVTLMRRAFELRCYVEVSTEGLKSGFYRITRVWREDDTEGVPNHTPWLTEGVPVRFGGNIAQIIARGEPVVVNSLDWDIEDPAYSELRGYRSVAASPGGLGEWHNWVMVFDPAMDAFTTEDLEVQVLRVNIVGQSMKNLSVLAELRKAKGHIDAEVDRIAEIQRSLLPPDSPQVPGLEVAAKFETFDRAGGDLYDYARMPDGRWGFLIADASGHGPSAAVVSAMLNAILHTYAADHAKDRPSSLVRVLETGNAQMVARCIEQSFVTAFLCIWDAKQQTLTYGRAGHPPPLVCRGDEVIPLGEAGGLPLGIFAESEYSETTFQLRDGDVVVMFTDGVLEAMDPAGEMFGESRLIQALKSADGSAQQVLDSLWIAITSHQAGGTPRDDQTLLVLKVKEEKGNGRRGEEEKGRRGEEEN
jgi:sigma-B regulation protein RsbU (phosphoserine phosphatase)